MDQNSKIGKIGSLICNIDRIIDIDVNYDHMSKLYKIEALVKHYKSSYETCEQNKALYKQKNFLLKTSVPLEGIKRKAFK